MDTEDEKDDALNTKVNSIKMLLHSANKKEDYDFILKKFNIKCKRNGKILSSLYLKLDVKKKIIKMATEDPEDVFDYDFYMNKMGIKG
uniref:Uncharacterized protein n=1 Tax=Florenciella sp. virus SA2 TaxID=3240092 RepID=A0AB39JFQ8_9VIRU